MGNFVDWKIEIFKTLSSIMWQVNELFSEITVMFNDEVPLTNCVTFVETMFTRTIRYCSHYKRSANKRSLQSVSDVYGLWFYYLIINS